MIYIKADKPRRSWHLLRTWTRAPGRAITLCGRTIQDPLEHDGVPAQRTCETCYRVNASRQQTEDDASTSPVFPEEGSIHA